ncbi:Histone deacetylase HOS3 [Tolypocladium capitatum]|uniref:Histone deacetylase HOS3 n=1 Tax=Tolypocladium capitatum TaxID=45235 RepID=A0A2K3QPB8_9HYPO|nr:Histone deacetylase HOS3 [Tolypocladium capitatum]
MANDDDTGLTQSLGQLSLTTQPAPSMSPRLKAASTPLQPPSRRSSTAEPRPRLPSRSPSNGRDSGASRAATPTLLRKASMNSLHSGTGAGSTRSVSRRSSSAQLLSPTTKNAPFGMLPQEEEKAPVTANSVASDYLQTELETHHGQVSTLPTETIVILNDAVYGHRFSRPRTSRGTLSTIVERPERIRACALGISAAYVRLGGRHSEGMLPIDPKRDVRALPGIPFRIHKTARRLPLTSQAVTNVHGTKWMDELKLMCDSAESKLAMGGKELQRPVMSRGPDDGPPKKLHEGDLYLCSESLAAIEGALGAVCEAVDAVFTTGHRRAFVGVRPPGHHCSASYPSGFCWVNNVHVGIMHAALAHGLTHAAIIDFDLHHGDGSQAITWQHNTRATAASKNAPAWKKMSIGYFSLHDINSYPCEMGDEEKVKNASLCIDNAHGQTVWNVHLQSWKTEQDFWQLYESQYTVLLEKTQRYLQNQAERLKALNQPPKAAVFFSAGFDASEWESAGMQRHHVNVPTGFYARITQDVVKLAAEEGLYVDGRVISVLEGGYSDRALCSGVFSHLSGLVGDQTPQKAHQQDNGLAFEMGQRIGAAAPDTGASGDCSLSSTHQYDPSWWASIELDKLERPSGPTSPPRKLRNSTPPTYSSPTQASTAKVADPIKIRRSLSGLSTTKVMERPPSPPPPEVPWAVAAHELSKLLIPTGRQTDSCKPEDLNAEATKARRDRQSSLTVLPHPPPEASSRPTSRMALRERRARAIGPIDEETVDQMPKPRRKTVVTPVASPDRVSPQPPAYKETAANANNRQPSTRSTPSRPNGSQPARMTSRRLSGAPAALSPAKEEPPPAGSDSGVSRTTSSTSSRTQGGGKLAVTKVRATAGARKDTAPRPPRSSPRKASTPARTRPTAATPQAPRPSTAPSAASDDVAKAMDNITTGMKKIRINLITQTQKETRERARLEAKKAASKAGGSQTGGTPAEPLTTPTIETPELPPAFTTTAAASPIQAVAPALPSPPQPASSSSGPRTPVEETSPSTVATPEPRQFAAPRSSPAVQPASDGDEIFIPYQPEGPTPVAVARQEPLKWLPPNVPTPSAHTPVATPSPMKKQNKLFQYTSGIPFAPRPQVNTPKPDALASATQVDTDDQNQTSVSDILETLQK